MISLINRIRSYEDKLSKSDKSLAEFILGNPVKAGKLSIQELSNLTHISIATISRFAKKIGYQSYQDLKFEMSSISPKRNDDFFHEINSSDSPYEMLIKNFGANIASLQATQAFITDTEIEKSVGLLLSAKKCAFLGLGASNAVALIAYHRFLKTPMTAFFSSDFHFQQMIAAKMTKGDCAIVISHSGKNRDTIRLVEILKERNVSVIGITSFAGSPFAEMVDIALISVAEETSYRLEAVSSTLSQISLLDSLFMIYGIQKKNKTNEALESIHEVIRKTRFD